MEAFIRSRLSMKIRQEPTMNPVDLTAGDVEQRIPKQGWAMVKYFAPWCTHCTTMQP